MKYYIWQNYPNKYTHNPNLIHLLRLMYNLRYNNTISTREIHWHDPEPINIRLDPNFIVGSEW
jgi:hypothetical protein